MDVPRKSIAHRYSPLVASTKTAARPHDLPGAGDLRSLRDRLRRLSPVRTIARSWRSLAANSTSARTLIACSGGADSGALALALWSAGAEIVLGHVVHDLRPPEESLADRDATKDLAARLGLSFVEASVRCRDGSNAEGAARRARYRALAGLASEIGAPFVASAHHADDQLESMIMGLLRGAGPAGLAGVAPSRSLNERVTLIRPMLQTSRADAESICAAAGFQWANDRTNLDTTRLRAALRHGPLADIAALRPGSAARASRAADHLRDACLVIESRVLAVFGEANSWPRNTLREETALVVGAGLRRAAMRITGGLGADRLGARVVDPVVRAVRDTSTEPRVFAWQLGENRVRVAVSARTVTLERT